jgi:hypothetical protein
MGLLTSFDSTRRLENLFTGARLTKTGHAAATTVGAGMVGKELLSNSIKQKGNVATGIRQAPQMSFDMKKTPNMGASGALTLALADVQKR